MSRPFLIFVLLTIPILQGYLVFYFCYSVRSFDTILLMILIRLTELLFTIHFQVLIVFDCHLVQTFLPNVSFAASS